MVKVGVLLNVVTLNYLLEVLFENSRIESALDQFRRMNKKGFSPSSRNYEIIIKGLILSNRLDDSVIILGEMFNAGFEPELSFYTCIIPLFCRGNELEEGIQLLRLMRASNLLPDELIYTELIRCMCKNHRLDDANNLLEEMIENGRTPFVDVLADLVVDLCAIGKFDEAMNFLEDKCGYITSPYNAMLEGCCNAVEGLCQARMIMEAAEIFHYVSKNGCSLHPSSYNMLIGSMCVMGQVDKALRLRGLAYSSDTSYTTLTYTTIMHGLSKLKMAIGQMISSSALISLNWPQIVDHCLAAEVPFFDSKIVVELYPTTVARKAVFIKF
ncbi:pentatricopeptide repeat-containing protein At1g12620-like [Mangifera indica]|uniref:pentatricopeptide repeat-containing protein At1g12620-like n=1 Tax=Mangifera indica TaxID=29780 RepID=UPI001CFA4164|nr:pentatricopeptide repeat-containing protein At1g12620-like [Mangifera indica]